MKTKEIFIPEGVNKKLNIAEDSSLDGSYILLAHVAKNATLTMEESINTTAALRTIRFTAFLEGEGASLVDTCRYQVFGKALLDIERVVVHAAPHTTSHVDARGVAGDAARVLWRGRIVVKREAKRAQAFQRHDAILASKDAMVDAAPFLEIFTHDVSCKHSASVRRIQPEHIFYMGSRGIVEDEARNMLLKGFLA